MEHQSSILTLRRPEGLAAVAILICSFSCAAYAQSTHHATAKKTAASKPAASDATPADLSALKSQGSRNAPITMEVFEDFECPSCGYFYEHTLKQVIADYVASGKVYLIHRDFPLPIHRYGKEAARWANAGARIGKFRELEAALFDNQEAWSRDGDIEKYVSAALTPAEYKRVQQLMAGCATTAAGVKPATFSVNAAQGCALDAGIDKDVALGNQIQVGSTPTFVVTCKGQRYPPASAAISYPVLKQFFDELLKQ